MIFAGVDWAEAHHDVLLVDAEGKRLGGGRLPEGVEGVAASTSWPPGTRKTRGRW